MKNSFEVKESEEGAESLPEKPKKKTVRRKKATKKAPKKASRKIAKPVTYLVERSKYGITETQQEKIETVAFVHKDTAFVSVKLGLTRQIAAYESARIDVTIGVPCYIEEIDQAFENVKSKCEDIIIAENEKIMGISNGEVDESEEND